MNYEERYKQALKVASQWHKDGIGDVKTVVKCIFPELCESVDEKIRKSILELVKQSTHILNPMNQKSMIAWLEKQGESKEKPTKEQVWDYCNKISSEWWQITMDKWNTLTDEDKNKYNQFIGFNDFSDTLMNITAGALFQLIDTGKLEYEEGSLLLEKTDDTPKPLEVINTINEKQGEQKSVEWDYPYGENETVDKLMAIAECLEMDEDFLYNGYTGTECVKFLRDLARKQVNTIATMGHQNIG